MKNENIKKLKEALEILSKRPDLKLSDSERVYMSEKNLKELGEYERALAKIWSVIRSLEE